MLGPGTSIVKQRNKILQFIEENSPTIISLNHVSNIYKPDYVFISNAKRYEKYANLFINKKNPFKVIATSNITALNNEFDFILNYGTLINSNDLIGDNSMGMLLTLFLDLKIKNISLAGFDGYMPDKNDYYDEYISFSMDNKDKILFNEALAKQIKTISKHININFLTESVYSKDFNQRE